MNFGLISVADSEDNQTKEELNLRRLLKTSRRGFRVKHIFALLIFAMIGVDTIEDEPSPSCPPAQACLALAIYAEARGESWLGQALVGQTALNRALDRRWPDDICGVVGQRWQFTGVHRWPIPREPADARAWEMAMQVAYAVMTGDYDVVACRGATHFYAVDAAETWTPDWLDGMDVAAECRVGGHVFLVEASNNFGEEK